MKISVIGTGYLGAVHAVCMAHLGHDVVGYDTNSSAVEALSSGVSPFYEPGFDELLRSTLQTGRLRFTSAPEEAVRGATLHFICVGTPQSANSEAADVSYVNAAVGMVADLATGDSLIVGKSTVPVGTAERLAQQIGHVHRGGSHEIAWNPEFLREGRAVEDTLSPDRLVFGVTSPYAEKMLTECYATLLDAGVPFVLTDLPTAEMVKVAANSFLATKISFINAMAEICEVAGADVVTLSRALGYDDRIGRKFLNAGLGFGGGCLPKDIRAFSARAGELGAPDAVAFLREIDKINMRRREKAVTAAAGLLGGSFLGKSVAVLGLAFKPDSDDVRDSPALNVAAAMHLKGADVRAHDPKALANARKKFPTLAYYNTLDEACRDADLIVLATEWQEYCDIDPTQFKSVVGQPVILDTRNALDHRYWMESGWRVQALGRGGFNV
jgi:UDPglucose 6-dehydrogenase